MSPAFTASNPPTKTTLETTATSPSVDSGAEKRNGTWKETYSYIYKSTRYPSIQL